MASDPWRNFKFVLEIDGFDRAGFRNVSGLNRSVEIIEYREGGENETPRKLPGQTTYENITLERGKSTDDDGEFLEWANQIFNLDQKDGEQPPEEDFRRDVVIYLKNKSGERIVKWTAQRAWVSEYQHDDLDAAGNDVLIERMVLAHEGLKEERGSNGAPVV